MARMLELDLPREFGDRAFVAEGPMTRLLRAAGIQDFRGAAHHLLRLPYGRITDRNKFWLVLEEGRGTCTTKHASLARTYGVFARNASRPSASASMHPGSLTDVSSGGPLGDPTC